MPSLKKHAHMKGQRSNYQAHFNMRLPGCIYAKKVNYNDFLRKWTKIFTTDMAEIDVTEGTLYTHSDCIL